MIKAGFAFVKAEALGNDFVIVDAIEKRAAVDSKDAVELCDRRRGIGADGVLLLESSIEASFSMRVLNADGSEAEMCGNGIRCAAKYAFDLGLVTDRKIQIATGAGIKTVEITEMDGEKAAILRVDLGEPDFTMIEETLPIGFDELSVTALNIGNPHAVVFVDDVADAPVVTVGRLIENHEAFPGRTNVEFVEIRSAESLRMRVWERGVGETSACGTGAAASLAAAYETKRTERKATVTLDGGDLLVEWSEEGKLYIEGGARMVYRGAMWED